MQLHHPSALRIFRRHGFHEGILEFRFLVRIRHCAFHPVPEDFFNLFFLRRGIHHIVQRVVAQLASPLHKEVQPLVQRFQQRFEGINFHARRCFQLCDVFRIGCLFKVHGFVRTPGRQHGDREALVRRQFLMPFKGVRRIIRCADRVHVAHPDQSPGSISFALQLHIGNFPYFLRRLLVQDAFISEEPPQFQVAPVVQGIPDGLPKYFRVFFEFLPVAGVAGDVFLRHAGAAHQTPLVVVPAQPNLGNVFIPDVLINLPGAQVAVIVDNRLLLRRLVIKNLRRLGVQKKIPIQKLFHKVPLLL